MTRSKQQNPQQKVLCWTFTINNYDDEDVNNIETVFNNRRNKIDYIVAGKEVGESGTPHLQGFLKFHHTGRKRLSEVKKLFNEKGHWEKMTTTVENCVVYCKKDGNFVEFGAIETIRGKRNDLQQFMDFVTSNPSSSPAEIRDKFPAIYARFPRFVVEYMSDKRPLPPMETHPLRLWQQELNELLKKEPDRRKIIFVVDYTGNSGKSWFAHYYASLHQHVQVLLPGPKKDLAFALDASATTLFIDAPRSKQGEFLSYDLMEDIKNGFVFSPKYESHAKRLSKCHVVVMMNEDPDMNKLSADRYHIITITATNNISTV